MARDLLVLSGGHRFYEAEFDQFLASLGDWDITHLRHPEAEVQVSEGRALEADALLFYDMGGYTFADNWVTSRPPSPEYRSAIVERFKAGRGAVAMHHALAGWADWPEWHDMLGGRFLYTPGEVRGEASLDSGYRLNVNYTAHVIGNHPVTTGLPVNFPLYDEQYLCHVFEAEVQPLLRSDFGFTRENFYSAALAISGTMDSNEDWDHPASSSLIGWHKRVFDAPLVYLQPGDTKAALLDPNVQKLFRNAVHFTAGQNP